MVKVFDLECKVVEEINSDLFNYDYKPDTIRRAVKVSQANRRQKYGTNPLAGLRSSAHYHGKRNYRFSMMNKSLARISRIHGKVGYMSMRARVVPQAVKGRRAHPPKAEKEWGMKLNKKEGKVAAMSAISATANKEIVGSRGHIYEEPPIVFVDDFESIKTTKEVKNIMMKIIPDEIKRAEKKKVRAGRGTMRGRRYNKKIGPLFVFSKTCDASKAIKNIPGFSSCTAMKVSVENLAPGTHAGRLTVYTKSSLEQLGKRFKGVKNEKD